LHGLVFAKPALLLVEIHRAARRAGNLPALLSLEVLGTIGSLIRVFHDDLRCWFAPYRSSLQNAARGNKEEHVYSRNKLCVYYGGNGSIRWRARRLSILYREAFRVRERFRNPRQKLCLKSFFSPLTPASSAT